ncbi:protealysin inhibitor emfourin [Propionicimonas sp.]|uniref:protealysin inhibitor emfourin n=1 Tax=Propionicimonas sp. TaxID=1955623 RepID=UPI0039E6E97E
MSHPMQIVPPYLLQHLAEGTAPIAELARATLVADNGKRRAREAGVRPSLRAPAAQAATGPSREIFDAHHTEDLPGTSVRAEGAAPTGDPAADEAYDGFGATWKLYDEVYGRNSIDGAGMRLLGSVHYGEGYQNAFWDGTRMVFGDGDGVIFGRFTASLDVIGHELTHGVTEHTANLTYRNQSGALNESISDVFGVLVAQYAAGETAEAADWLVGAELLLPGVKGTALRNMLHPGTAYDDPRLGKDPQPADMSGYVKTTSDNGGVHYNSGIPNRAFALAATSLGGHAWEKAGQIWYDVLTGAEIAADCDFAAFAELTIDAAVARFGDGAEAAAVRQAWLTVGVTADAAGATPSGDEQVDPHAQLLLRRSGGFAGLTRERRRALADLDDEDRRAWNGLLAGETLPRLAAAAEPKPDAYCYGVVCPQADVDVELAESGLPAGVRRLFERFLGEHVS